MQKREKKNNVVLQLYKNLKTSDPNHKQHKGASQALTKRNALLSSLLICREGAKAFSFAVANRHRDEISSNATCQYYVFKQFFKVNYSAEQANLGTAVSQTPPRSTELLHLPAASRASMSWGRKGKAGSTPRPGLLLVVWFLVTANSKLSREDTAVKGDNSQGCGDMVTLTVTKHSCGEVLPGCQGAQEEKTFSSSSPSWAGHGTGLVGGKVHRGAEGCDYSEIRCMQGKIRHHPRKAGKGISPRYGHNF